ncbi:MAG TPA: hypothetical protein VIO32_07855 [Candidatus Baltobacteraceae bacterium]
MNRNEPSERIWTALKRMAGDEQADLTQPEAIKRVKAIARREGALALPGPALEYYAREYRSMVNGRKELKR